MGKGELTRNLILDRAFETATQLGLEGLSIGALSASLGMSKSGMFAHFGSKEALQLAVLEHAAERFRDDVVRPLSKVARGRARLAALFEQWLTWQRKSVASGGCFFTAAAFELDDRPGPVRERLIELQRDFHSLIAQVARAAVEEGEFRADLDVQQLTFELKALVLGTHYFARLLGDTRAESRARIAFAELVTRARTLD